MLRLHARMRAPACLAAAQALLLYLQAAEMGSELGQSNAAWMIDRGFGHAGPAANAIATSMFKRSAEQVRAAERHARTHGCVHACLLACTRASAQQGARLPSIRSVSIHPRAAAAAARSAARACRRHAAVPAPASPHALFSRARACRRAPARLWPAARPAACAQGNVASLLALGDAYFYGRGVPRDATRSAAIYYEAYRERSPEAMFNLGYCHEYGAGVPQVRAARRARWRGGFEFTWLCVSLAMRCRV